MDVGLGPSEKTITTKDSGDVLILVLVDVGLGPDGVNPDGVVWES